MIGEKDTRPWGGWEVLDAGDGYQVKRLTVLPHSRLSYQTHEFRAEHWVVAQGRATSVIDGKTVVSEVGECVDVEIGVPHRLGNNDDELLVVIEVQRGSYLNDDDIIRLEDDFGRAEDRQ